MANSITFPAPGQSYESYVFQLLGGRAAKNAAPDTIANQIPKVLNHQHVFACLITTDDEDQGADISLMTHPMILLEQGITTGVVTSNPTPIALEFFADPTENAHALANLSQDITAHGSWFKATLEVGVVPPAARPDRCLYGSITL